METILVLGSSGLVGGGVVEALRQRGVAVREASRRAAVPFDLTEPKTFAPALEGIEKVFLISRPGDDDPDVVAAPLLEAMRGAGVRHVVNLSAMGTEQRPGFGLRRLEVALEKSGLAWTHLRPNWFMQIFDTPPLGPILRATGGLALPAGDARISFVDARDISEVAAACLLDARWERQAFTLTGPSALDHAAAMQELSQATGRTFTYRAQTEEEGREALARAGFPPARVERLVGFYRLVRAEYAAPVTDDIGRVLGRPARTFAAWCRDYASRFGGGTVERRSSGNS